MYSGSKFNPSQINPDYCDARIAFAKAHEHQALQVERELRQIFNQKNIFVTPAIQYKGSDRSALKLHLQISDGNRVNDHECHKLVNAAKEIYAKIYKNDDVYMSAESLSLMPAGDSLKYLVDQMLALRYGHNNYRVDFFEYAPINFFDLAPLLPVYELVVTNAYETNRLPDDDIEKALYNLAGKKSWEEDILPQEVLDSVMNMAKTFRPYRVFIPANDMIVDDCDPFYSRGFTPDDHQPN